MKGVIATQGLDKAQEIVGELIAEEEPITTRVHPEISDAECKMETFINRAIHIIYSTEKDIFKTLEKDFLAGLEPFDLLIAYIAISIAASARFQIRRVDIEIALKGKLYPTLPSLRDLRTLEEYTQFLELYKLEAELNLAKIEVEFYLGKLAYETGEHSYNGILYSTAKAKKRPLSQEERQEASTLATKFVAPNFTE